LRLVVPPPPDPATPQPALFKGYELVGRVWDGKVVRGGFDKAEEAPGIYATPSGIEDWQHQQVFVLRKPA